MFYPLTSRGTRTIKRRHLVSDAPLAASDSVLLLKPTQAYIHIVLCTGYSGRYSV